MQHTTETPALARTARSTAFTLGRALKTVRFRDGKTHYGDAYAAPYGVMSAIEIHVNATDHGIQGLTFSNGI